jgi:hypothetical protein
MQINADLSKDAVIQTGALDWSESPMAGVERKMLERDGEEVARATSLVRYEAGSYFSEHVHDLGEEFLVLEGTFSDEHGDYPQGTYVRNPPGSKHTPFSKDGCVILVKLRQMALSDQSEVRVDTHNADWAALKAFDYLELYSCTYESVSMMRTHEKAIPWEIEDLGGLEFFVLEGALVNGGARYDKGTWGRMAAQKFLDLEILSNSLIWFKTRI